METIENVVDTTQTQLGGRRKKVMVINNVVFVQYVKI